MISASSQGLRGMPRTRPPAIHSPDLDLASLPNKVKQEDIRLILDAPSPINMDDDDEDGYIEEIPGVTRLGIKRACPSVTHSAPTKLQAIAPRTTNCDPVQLTKKLDFSTTDKPVTSLLNIEGDMWVKDGGKMRREKKMRDLAEVTHREIQWQLRRGLREELSAQKLQFKNHFNACKEHVTEKERQIVRLERENTNLKLSKLQLNTEKLLLNTEKLSLIMRHDRELEDVKESLRKLNTKKERLVVRHKREIQHLKDSILELSTEKEGLVMRHSREIHELKYSLLDLNIEKARQDLTTRSSREKTLREDRRKDRRRQKMAAYRC